MPIKNIKQAANICHCSEYLNGNSFVDCEWINEKVGFEKTSTKSFIILRKKIGTSLTVFCTKIFPHHYSEVFLRERPLIGSTHICTCVAIGVCRGIIRKCKTYMKAAHSSSYRSDNTSRGRICSIDSKVIILKYNISGFEMKLQWIERCKL